MSDDPTSAEAARRAGERGELDQWVTRFLASPGSDNAPLGSELTRANRRWLGPVPVPIDQLRRLAGPPGAPVLQPLEDDEWRDDVDDLADQVRAGQDPPPVIATCRHGQLYLEDGNHRVEALRRAGSDTAWAVIGFDTPEERDRYAADH